MKQKDKEEGLEVLFGKTKDSPNLALTAWTIPIGFTWIFVPIDFNYKLIGFGILIIIGGYGIFSK